MALDEEIRWARQLAAAHDEQRREERRQRAAEQAELKSALAEAVERLRPFEGKRLRRYEVCKSWFGADRSISDSGGRRWRAVSEQRCWVILDHFGVGMRPKPVVLVEDGTLGRVTEDNSLACNLPDVLAVRGPLESVRDDIAFRRRGPTNRPDSYNAGGFDVNAVKRKLADAIVVHEKKKAGGKTAPR